MQSQQWGLANLQGLMFYIRMIWLVRKVVKEQNISEIHCGRVIHEGLTARLVKLLCGVPFVVYVHGEDVETGAISREINALALNVCKNANYVICNSQNSAEIVKRLGYAESNKIKVLHPGVDLEKFRPATNDEDFKSNMNWTGRSVILTVGRLQERKGQDMMIKAMPEIIKAIPEALYVIVGTGDNEIELKKIISALNMHDFVKILTSVSDEQMIQCYQQCQLFILPNRTIGKDIEGFGMVLVEAQASGKPVIAGDSGGTKETMKIGETGVIVDCTSSIKIANAVIDILADKSKMKKMEIASRIFAEECFGWEAHVEKAQKLFEIQ